MRGLLFLVLALSCSFAAMDFGGEGSFKLFVGHSMRSFNNVYFFLDNVSFHQDGNATIVDNATYRLVFRSENVSNVTLKLGDDYHGSIDIGGGEVIKYFIIVRSLGYDPNEIERFYAYTKISTAVYSPPDPPVISNISVTPSADGANFSWETDMSSNGTIYIDNSTAALDPDSLTKQNASVSGLAPDRNYTFQIEACSARCNKTEILSFRTLAGAQKNVSGAVPTVPPVPKDNIDYNTVAVVLLAVIVVVFMIIAGRTSAGK